MTSSESRKIENLVGVEMSIIPPPAPPAVRPSFVDRFKSVLKSTGAGVSSLSLQLAAHDDPELVTKLAPYEKNVARVRGFMQIVDFGFKAGGLTVLYGYVAGGVSVVVVGAAAGTALYLVLVDHFVFVRSALPEAGLSAMSDTRLRIKVPSTKRRSARWAKAFRIGVSVTTAIVVALILGLKIDRPAIVQQEQLDFLANNHGLIDQAERDFDTGRQRLEQNIRSSTYASTHGPARRRAQAEQELQQRQDELSRLNAGRADTLERWIKAQPSFIPKNESLAGDIKAYGEFLWANPAAGWLVLALTVGAIAMDLITATLSLIFVPSAYSAEVMRRQLESLIRTSRAAAAQLRPLSEPPDDRPPTGGASAAAKPPAVLSEEPESPAAPTIVPHETPHRPASPPTAMNGVTPPAKRGRGRPKGSGKSADRTETSNA
jgi:hypothetical protein